MKTLKLILTISAAIFLASCSPEDGKDGINGATGATGSANVIYSEWLTTPAAVPDNIDGTTGTSFFFDVPELTNEMLEKGTILTYFSYSGIVNPIPYTSRAGGSTNTILSVVTLNKIKFFRFSHDGSAAPGFSSTLLWRYILIPGGIPAASGKQLNLDYSKMSYEEVCMHLKINP